MKRILLAASFVTALFVSSSTFAASVNLLDNGNFDDGLMDWNKSGDVSVASANLLGMDGNFALLGFCTTAGKSSVSQSFDLTGYDLSTVEISFNWFFWNYDASNTKDTYISLFEDSNNSVSITLQELISQGTNSNPSSKLLSGTYTALLSDLVDLSSLSGIGATLSFSLYESGTKKTNSIVGIDNVSVTASSTSVPEPATMLLWGTGIVGLATTYRKKKQD